MDYEIHMDLDPQPTIIPSYGEQTIQFEWGAKLVDKQDKNKIKSISGTTDLRTGTDGTISFDNVTITHVASPDLQDYNLAESIQDYFDEIN